MSKSMIPDSGAKLVSDDRRDDGPALEVQRGSRIRDDGPALEVQRGSRIRDDGPVVSQVASKSE